MTDPQKPEIPAARIVSVLEDHNELSEGIDGYPGIRLDSTTGVLTLTFEPADPDESEYRATTHRFQLITEEADRG